MSSESKAALKKMDLEQGLYAQVVITRRRNLEDIKEKYKTKKLTYKDNQQEQKNWFGLDDEWMKEIFMTHEPDFYKTT